jgi:hypothetical protein
MGGTNSRDVKIEGIKVREKNSQSEISLRLSDNFKYPPKPSDVQVKEEMKNLLEKLDLNENQLKELGALGTDVQWKLICKHKDYMSKNEPKLKKNALSYTETEEIVLKLKGNPSLLELKNLRKWMKESSTSQRCNFYLFEGLQVVINILEVTEVCSRNTKNYKKQVALLKIVEEIIKFKDGIEELIRIPDAISVILFNFNFFHVEITSVVLEILSNLMYSSDEVMNLILEAANKLKKERNYLSRFQPFFEILSDSLNIVLIENVLAFLSIVLTSSSDRNTRNVLKSELDAFGFTKILEVKFKNNLLKNLK